MEASDSELDDNEITSSPQREKWCGHQFLFKFQGFWFTKTYLETTKRVVETLQPLTGDVILASFPKTGTTWLKAILHSILHPSPQHQNHPLALNHPQELVPSLETNLYVDKGTELDGGYKNPEFLAVKDPKKQESLATHIPRTRFLKSSDVEKDPWEVGAAVDQFCRGLSHSGPTMTMSWLTDKKA
ncbi:UNVERIFIED_CONTAM: Cytosolic sulfotransferase 5 [Sesamum indicum]